MSKKEKNEQNSYTFDEYTQKFFPSKAKKLQMAIDSPKEFGVKLANETISELRQILARDRQ